MEKITFEKPGTLLYPLPAVLISCGETPETYNITTVAWTGTINSEPPIVYISLRKSRHSHAIISKTGEFVINLTTESLARTTDWCGVRSGRDYRKFQEMKLTPQPAQQINCPMIAQSPLNLECRVRQVVEYPSHDMFIADVLAVHADKSLFDEHGRMQLESAGLLVYSHGGYFAMRQRPIGKFGFSVQKKRPHAHRAKGNRSRFSQ